MLVAAVLSALAWRWNATSAALAFAYFVTQGWFLIAGRGLDAGELFMIDVFTVALIFCKAIARCPDQDFLTGWQHFRCFLRAPTKCDWVVLGLFPLVWLAYVLTIGDGARWWALFWLSMLQFAAAGHDAFTEWRKAKRAGSGAPGTPSSGLQFALARAGGWST
jgi:hypothetical protein